MNTSIVIPLGTGSRWNNTELRYCLRSVEKHLTGYGEVFIIGEKPSWLRNIIHIPFDEGKAPQAHEKERNIYNKIMAACNDERVSDNFLFMNDDHFLLQDYEAGQFPDYCEGWLSEIMTVTDYKYTVWNTHRLFPGHMVYYDIHCPMLYNKGNFKSAMAPIDWSLKFGYCIKTVYSNYVTGRNAIEYPDLKINEACPAENIRELIVGRPWFSIGDRAREGEMLHVLQELYPHKSKFE